MKSFLSQLTQLASGNSDGFPSLGTTLDDWLEATDADVAEFAELLPEIFARADLDRITPPLTHAVEHLATRQRVLLHGRLAESTVALLAAAYRKLPADNKLRAHILRVLVSDGGRESLAEFARAVVEDPPVKTDHATLAIVSLAQDRMLDARSIYPALLDGVAHRSVAASLLDVTNYLVREGRLDEHPAADRVARLAKLAEGVTAELERLEQSQPEGGRAGETVAESVELAVALCDTLALVGDKSVVGKLTPMLELRHRRIQAEAASALARLGEDQGLAHLASLAEHAVVRTRSLAYLEELDAIERVDEQFRSPQARAEGELAVWLADPTNFGFPPQTIGLIDARQQFWPGFEKPIDCFLFRFVYPLPGGDFVGVAFGGPTVEFFQDVSHLTPEEIYALQASMEIDHEDCFETPAEEFDESQFDRAQQAGSLLATLGYNNLSPVLLGNFFGKELLVFQADQEGKPGAAIVDLDANLEATDRITWLAAGSPQRPLSPEEAYGIHIGQLLLQSLNAPP